MRFVLSGFLVLHGLVHLLYFGHSRRLFGLRPGRAKELPDQGAIAVLINVALLVVVLVVHWPHQDLQG